MPSASDPASVPSEVVAVVRRYHRAERAASWLVALLVVAVALTAIRTLDLLPATLAVLALVAVVRVPAVRRGGHTRLTTDADPATVASDFRSVTPPVLAFQWGIADGITTNDERTGEEFDGFSTTRATYEFSYLLGLRSVSMDLTVRSARSEGVERAVENGDEAVETLEVSATAGGRPWGTYRVSIREGDGETVVDVESTTDRRFDLRSVPQALVAERYFGAALAAQGYRVVDRDVSWSM
ncbi:hypothetical protein [Halorubrum sp. F4]|uniref:hypothetical protein n=1 Tax=Halorubrum sp. F4 TaxID=2989715 RepID=UPI00247FB721|nr:hypothetical protein [Halorubrum sp. F4]